MNGLNVGSDRREELSATSAILLYSGRDQAAVYGTVHPINSGKNGRASIGAGRPIDRSALLKSLAELSEHAAPRAEFLPETVLAVSQDSVTWWCRPGTRRVFFDCQELGKRSAIAPHPGLVFRAASNGFSVFALKEDSRPTPDSTLHEPPYFNTWDFGRICIGTAHVPKRIDISSIAGWERASSNRRSLTQTTVASVFLIRRANSPSGKPCSTASLGSNSRRSHLSP